MKRFILTLSAVAMIAGCQTLSGLDSNRSGVARSHNWTEGEQGTAMVMPIGVPQAAKTAGLEHAAIDREIFDPQIELAGYDRGPGSKRNMAFVQKVARAVPSYGGVIPGSPPGAATGSLTPAGCGPDCGPGYGGGCGPDCGPGCGPAGAYGSGPPGAMIGLGPRFIAGRTQVRFVNPVGMKIAWQNEMAESMSGFTEPQLETPARFNFVQAQIYRLKLTQIPDQPGIELYPTLEVYPGNIKINAYLSHNAVPITFSDEDIDQVMAGNYVTKVIYLPDPEFQELAISGVETLVSTRLDPGIDPVQEAHRRGAILAVVRIGSIDLEMPHSPPLIGMRDAGNAIDSGLIPVSAVTRLPQATELR